jgi:hypothetical protein
MYLTQVEYGILLTTSPLISWSSFAMVRPTAADEINNPKVARHLKMDIITMNNREYCYGRTP